MKKKLKIKLFFKFRQQDISLLVSSTKIGRLKTGQILSCLMSLNFCWDIQMVESEFGVNRSRTWIHHALLPLCRMVVVV